MSDKILEPYKFLEEEQQIIKAHFSIHTDWEKPIFNSIKSNIIAHLRIQQNNQCCYCKYPLGFDIKEVDIEHILPKSKHSNFTFESLNLSLSCPGCNTKKSSKEVVILPVKKYPKSGKNIKIIHAHFNTYSNHIRITNNCVFNAKSLKGSETISYCELFRLEVVEEKVLGFKSFNNIKSIISELKTCPPELKKEFVNELLSDVK